MSRTAPVSALKNDPTHATERKTPSPSPAGVTSHWTCIGTSLLVVTVPITVLTIALLIMVFQYRVSPNNAPFANLNLPSTNEGDNAIYVDLNSSVILFVASWASSLAPMLSSFLMTLASFPIARQLSNNIRNGRIEYLPTPYQLGLTLKFIDGGALGAIWGWIMYFVSWRKTRRPQTPVLVTTSNVAMLVVLMGILVSVADTWLHLTTTTVDFTEISRVADPKDYSFGIVPDCLIGNNSLEAQFGLPPDNYSFCSVNIAATNVFLRNPPITYQVISNLSSEATVYTHTDSHGKSYTYFGIPSDTSTANHDFTAHSYGAHTSCSLITQACHAHSVLKGVRFNCSAAFSGAIYNPSLQSVFFSDETMKNTSFQTRTGTGNPYYIGLATLEGMGVQGMPGKLSNRDFQVSMDGATAFVLGCKSTVYDVEYDRVNGSITRFDTQPSNTSVSNIWQVTMSQQSSAWEHPLKQAMVAALISTNSSQEFVDMVALSFSKASMAFGAQGIERRPSLALQSRNTKLVARLPIAPLVALVVFCLLFVATGLLLTAVAIWAARLDEARNIQASLGIFGLIADRFEDSSLKRKAKDVENFFAEYIGKTDRRIAIESDKETETYRYKTLENTYTTDSGSALLRR